MQHTTTRIHAGLLALAFAAAPFSTSFADLLSEERIRREAATQQAVDLLLEGRKSYSSKSYEEAVRLYREALSTLPFGPKTEVKRNEIQAHLADGSVALAQHYRRLGKYNEAKGLLNDVLVTDPNRFDVQKSLEYLDDPIRTNPSLTYEHSQNVDEVRRLLYKGEGFYNLGDYDKAEDKFHAVLRIDKYNKAARRWLEKCSAIKSDYYRAAYDQTRATLLAQVDQAWELTIPPAASTGEFTSQNSQRNSAGSTTISNKLRSIVIPRIDFEDTSLDEVRDYLTQKSIELDPSGEGINFVIEKGSTSAEAGSDDGDIDGGDLIGDDSSGKKVALLRLRNVPLSVVLDYVCSQTGTRYRVDEYAVTILPLDHQGGENLVTRTWTVPPTFKTDLAGGGGDGGESENDDPFGGGAGLGGGGIANNKSMADILGASGVSFGEGASARFISSSSTLIVRNTISNLDLVDEIVNQTKGQQPKQIRIMTKFVEVAQENTDELGFDWIVNPFGQNFAVGGGSQGNAGGRNLPSDFVGTILGSAGSTRLFGENPNAGTTTVTVTDTTAGTSTTTTTPNSAAFDLSRPVTSGLRSGDFAVEGNSIDAILNNPNRLAQTQTVAPGILSLTGIFNGGGLQAILRGLSQKKGTDIMTAPSVLARSGETATVQIIREFIYPTEYEAPELPNEVRSSGDGGFPVTPATPTAFQTRNTGVSLEIEPTIGANDYVIDLSFAPEIVEFEGFVNYGSPIQSGGVILTENRIEMPVFGVRRVNTGLTIYDGHTVAVGGLMREDVQKVEDKVPIFGDLPWIGRLFRSNSENHVKSNLIIFVTAQIIDATGQPVNGSSTGLGDPALQTTSFSAPAGADAGVLPPLN